MPPRRAPARPAAPHPPVRLRAADLRVFERYPESVSWKQVLPADQERLRHLRHELKRLAAEAANRLDGPVPLRPYVSALTPNGRSRADLWCWLHPRVSPHHSFTLQFALILTAAGAELCFCMGKGTAHSRDRAVAARGEDFLDTARERLREIPLGTVSSVQSALGTAWHYRRRWKQPDARGEFADLSEWLAFAASDEGAGASISQYFSPAELESLGATLLPRFVASATLFQPVFEFVYGPVGVAGHEPFPEPLDAVDEDEGGGAVAARVPESYAARAKELRAAAPALQASEPRGLAPGGSFDAAAAVRTLRASVDAQGFVYEPWQLAAYVTAVRTKPFVILAGVTGTGKSRLPSLVARATGAEVSVLPVRPDWTDSSEVLGFTDLSGRFRPGPLLKIVRRAAEDPGGEYFAVMDEMNLARVEHYFAEVLSRIEDLRAPDDPRGPLPLLEADLPESASQWASLELPRNLCLVGTVNMDESTHGFSRKVLDRAFTIELSDVDLSRWARPARGSTAAPAAPWPAAAWRPRARRLSELEHLAADERRDVERAVATLGGLNAPLSRAQLQIGYRTRDEVALFVLHARDAADSFVTRAGVAVDPLDLALQMKVLPRVAGGTGAVRRLLLDLLGFAQNGAALTVEDDARALLERWENAGRGGSLPGARFPRTAARLCLMWERLANEGFTSFWM